MALGQFRSGDKGSYLLLFDHFPVDIFLDIRMVDIHCHHLGRAAGRAARFDGPGGTVANPQEAHQPRGFAAARQALAFTAEAAEVRSGAGPVFEQPCLADPQIHNAAFIHQIVIHRLDETGMRLRMLIGAGRTGQLASLEIDIEMSLAWAVDAIGPVQAGVEPLR